MNCQGLMRGHAFDTSEKLFHTDHWGKKGQAYGDIAITEKKHFRQENTLSGETCWCLEQSWFWKEGFKPKPAANILKQMEIAHSRGANFLLNLAPDPKGRLIPASVEVLKEIGSQKP